MASNSKQYGLILPQKANQGLVRDRPSIFKDSSDSEEEGGGATDWVRKALKRESERTFVKKQHQLDIQKVLAEDPTVYQYDEVYDKIEEKKAELSNAKKQLDKKPRYIQSLLQQAEKRKRENERRNERIIQKEREAEGDQFKDKESFVTSAYRQKLEEFKKLEEEEKYQDAIEALTDVSKQKDLSGFYRHLYRQTVTGEERDKTIKTEKDEAIENSTENLQPRREDIVVKEEPKELSNENKNTSGNIDLSSADNSDPKNTTRHYRKRKNSSASSNSDDENTSKSKPNENIDADSDFSVDSDSSDSESEGSDKEKNKKNSEKSASNVSVPKNTTNSGENEEVPNSTSAKRSGEDDGNEGTSKKRKEEKTDEKEDATQNTKPVDKEEKEKTPKVNIWIKRTVGDVFDNALQRYYQRKAERMASKG